jgi:hypothetical protein
MKGQTTKTKGLTRRLGDLRLERVPDPRQDAKVKWSLPTLLSALVVGVVTTARSLHVVEQRTAQIPRKHPKWQGLVGRIADNTFGRVLQRLRVTALVWCLHRMVKAEQRRKNLKRTRLHRHTVAVDGKHVATLRWHDLCRLLGPGRATADPEDVRQLLAQRYPEAQLHVPDEGEPYALMRWHTATLVSSEAAVCLHVRPILGDTNEVASMPELPSVPEPRR